MSVMHSRVISRVTWRALANTSRNFLRQDAGDP